MSTFSCPNCGSPVLESAAFCDQCGSPLTVAAFPGLCPNCRAGIQPDDLFCNNCGYALRDPQPPLVETLVITYEDLEQEPATAGRLAPHLQVLPTGNVLSLNPDQDSYIIGRIDPASGSYPDVDLVPFGGEEGGVSRRHAQITRTDQGFVVEDLNSVNYTFVNKNKIVTGTAHALKDGDEIRLGRVLLRFNLKE